jgi:hypothetical protein
MTNQERSDLLRTAKKIEKNADLYERCPIFKSMVDNTIWLTPEQIHESQRLAPGLGPYRYNDVIEEDSESL